MIEFWFVIPVQKTSMSEKYNTIQEEINNFKANVPVNVIKDILAHSDVKTTMRYIHCTEGAKQDALSKLN